MIIDLKPIYNGEKDVIEFAFDFSPESVYGTVEVSSSCSAQGKVFVEARGRTKEESYVQLDITVVAPYKTECARCAALLEPTLRHRATYCVSSKEDINEFEDVVCAPGGKLDLYNIADSLVSLNLPMRTLCKEDCKGLCQECGADLNSQKCTCFEKKGDPRLAILQKLLDKE